MANTNTISPKVGFAYDLTGDNRTVLKAFYGLSRWNSADTLADQENPVGLAQLRYAFVSCAAGQTTGCDLNGNRLVSRPPSSARSSRRRAAAASCASIATWCGRRATKCR